MSVTSHLEQLLMEVGPRGGTTRIQAMLFDKEKYTEAQARKWCEEHNMKVKKVSTHEDGKYVRCRIESPKKFKTFRTSTKPEQDFGPGIKAIFGIE